MDVRKADIVDTELEVLTMLHNCHRMVHDMESVAKGSFKLLFVTNEHTIPKHSSLATKFR